ncbi:MAG: glycosyltransferase, partial [Bacteroidales bacterium]|nr:glycosyltransferase [Bacteroidales bacterium]
RENPDVHLLLVGAEEPEGKSILDSSREMISRSSHIHLSSGWQADVRPWYAAADALVHPSHREGFPNVVIEAGAMELSSIVTDINGSREIIKDGKNGSVVPARDEDALYEAMTTFIRQPKQVHKMASEARRMIARRYEQRYVRDCLKAFYKEVLP